MFDRQMRVRVTPDYSWIPFLQILFAQTYLQPPSQRSWRFHSHSQMCALLLLFSRSAVSDSVTPWTAAHQASLSITSSRRVRCHFLSLHWGAGGCLECPRPSCLADQTCHHDREGRREQQAFVSEGQWGTRFGRVTLYPRRSPLCASRDLLCHPA